jgi:hypothetical protein
MTYNLQTFRSALKTLLQTVTEVAYVYDRRNPNIEGYPAIIFDITKNQNEMLTNVENLRETTFTIWLIAEVGVAGMANANSYLDNVTKKVVEALEDIDNLSLGGNVDWIMPVEGAREEVSSTQGSAIWQILELRVRVSSSVL